MLFYSELLTCRSLGSESNLCSNSLSNLLKAPLIMEFESPAKALCRCDGHTLVKVRSGLQVLPGLLLQLLTELLPLYRSNVSYTNGGELMEKNQGLKKEKKKGLSVCVYR